LGNLFYPPNQKGFEYVINELMPQLCKSKKVILKSIGMIPEELKSRYKNRSDVIILGEIKNEQMFVNEVGSSSVGLCTVFAGSGMKIKILDYCLAGLPIVSTTIGASGYEEISSLIIKDDKEQIIEAILGLLDDATSAQEIGLKNKAGVLNLYGWSKICEKFETALALAEDFNLRHFEEATFQPFWLEEKRHAVDVLHSHFIIENEGIHECK
jgi:polysaccharide biosynthesis protein PslH